MSRAEAVKLDLRLRNLKRDSSHTNTTAAAATDINWVSFDDDELPLYDQVPPTLQVDVQAEYDAPPLSWTPQLHDVDIFDVEDEGERAEVYRTFYASLDRTRHGTINVIKLQRIQNRPLWKEYGEWHGIGTSNPTKSLPLNSRVNER